jgi:hypothetical protein
MVRSLSGGIYAVKGFKKMPGRVDYDSNEAITRAMYAVSAYGADDDTGVLFFNAHWIKKIDRGATETSQFGGYAIPLKIPPGTDTIIIALDND